MTLSTLRKKNALLYNQKLLLYEARTNKLLLNDTYNIEYDISILFVYSFCFSKEQLFVYDINNDLVQLYKLGKEAG